MALEGAAVDTRMRNATRHGEDAGQDITVTVRAVWTEVLGIEHLDPTDNFFELGGTSLQAMMIVSRIRARLGLEVPIGAILADGSFAELCVLVETTRQQRP